MSNVTEYASAQRKNAYQTPGYPAGNAYGHPSQAQTLRTAQYMNTGNPAMPHHGDTGVANLAHGFGAMNLQPASYNTSGRNSQVPASGADYGNITFTQGQALYFPPGQQIMYSGGQLLSGNAHSNGMYPSLPQYMQHNYSAGYMGHMGENTPHASHWNNRVTTEGPTVPTLITPRRGSVSSNEEHIPSTPFNGFGGPNAVTVVDRSPSGAFTQGTTPSPSQFIHPYGVPHAAKTSAPSPIPVNLKLLLKQDPPIPKAIPAPSSPIKPLDRCLENKNGETNVYIRGLLPETTDDMLHNWGSRFGDIASSKSIIDHKTNLCKGFGFIKYHNFEDAEACIRGFHHLGYEVSFARESFYSKLKKFADETNTNLYVSNIPRNFNEHELSTSFQPFKVCSARILRDERGNGRGVGFARFESRDVCEEIIKKFNNTPVAKPGGEEHIIQIRYSDTHEQKMLKQQTAAARQFRAAEFEFGCIQAGRNAVLHPERMNSVSPSVADAANEFEHFLQKANAVNVGTYGQPPAAHSTATLINSRPVLPTIKSEATASTQLVLTAGPVKAEGDIALGADGKAQSPTPVASQKSSPAKSAAVEKSD